jgi:hypothetical protein
MKIVIAPISSTKIGTYLANESLIYSEGKPIKAIN